MPITSRRLRSTRIKVLEYGGILLAAADISNVFGGGGIPLVSFAFSQLTEAVCVFLACAELVSDK